MPIFSGITKQQASSNAISRLMQLRAALEACSDYHEWMAAYSNTELEALGFSADDVVSLRSAFADANELNILFNGGGLGTYTIPYPFSNSARVIIGPAS